MRDLIKADHVWLVNRGSRSVLRLKKMHKTSDSGPSLVMSTMADVLAYAGLLRGMYSRAARKDRCLLATHGYVHAWPENKKESLSC